MFAIGPPSPDLTIPRHKTKYKTCATTCADTVSILNWGGGRAGKFMVNISYRCFHKTPSFLVTDLEPFSFKNGTRLGLPWWSSS